MLTNDEIIPFSLRIPRLHDSKMSSTDIIPNQRYSLEMNIQKSLFLIWSVNSNICDGYVIDRLLTTFLTKPGFNNRLCWRKWMLLFLQEWNRTNNSLNLSSTRRYGSLSSPGRYSILSPKLCSGTSRPGSLRAKRLESPFTIQFGMLIQVIVVPNPLAPIPFPMISLRNSRKQWMFSH